MAFLVLGVIFLVSFVFHDPGETLSLGGINPPSSAASRSPSYPVVDFEFKPIITEPTPGLFPRLLLTIRNRGDFAITEVRIRATEYTLKKPDGDYSINEGD
jgi:hypothetical protein